MQFTSWAFAPFLTIVFFLFWLAPIRFRWIVCLAASYAFYLSWGIKFSILLLVTTIITYFTAIFLEKSKTSSSRKMILAVSVCLILSGLFFFKYFNFFTKTAADVLGIFGIYFAPLTLKLMLPVGISFYTFQSIGYIADVYRGKISAERHFGYYALFVSFFPQILSGPIGRAPSLLGQLRCESDFDPELAAYGLKQMGWGFFKKLVIADVLAGYTSIVYDNPQDLSGFVFVLAAFFYGIQIYCDFSGYSDIAIGLAKLLGINLTTNFKCPYFSAGMKDFWSRWHISLSTWFRDYVYIPLGGNRVSKPRHFFNILITFLLSGLWHGANLTFVVWGALHGVFRSLEDLIWGKRKSAGKVIPFIRTIGTFVIADVLWIFFASASIKDALHIIGHAFDNISAPVAYVQYGLAVLNLGGDNKIRLIIILITILILTLYDLVDRKTDCIKWVTERKRPVKYTIYVLVILAVVFMHSSTPAQFVYFNF